MKLIFTSGLLMFLIDRITKFFALKFHNISISFITFLPTKNKGIAFGLFSEYPGIISFLTIIICIVLIIYTMFLKERSLFFKIGMGMFIGGAISNLQDRIIYGSVIDFISIGIGNLRWPTFNLADCGIVIGAILIILAGKVKGSTNP